MCEEKIVPFEEPRDSLERMVTRCDRKKLHRKLIQTFGKKLLFYLLASVVAQWLSARLLIKMLWVQILMVISAVYPLKGPLKSSKTTDF